MANEKQPAPAATVEVEITRGRYLLSTKTGEHAGDTPVNTGERCTVTASEADLLEHLDIAKRTAKPAA